MPIVMLKERQKSILDAVIEEYLESAVPVASRQIVNKFKMPYSPATVRADLLALDDEGFLEQPHTSAGRIPTDKGYRFYFEIHESRLASLTEKEKEVLSILFRMNRDEAFLKSTARAIAQISECFATAGFIDDYIFYKSGLADVFQEPEFEDRRMVEEFSELTEYIDEEIKEAFGEVDFHCPKIFIGRENPIKEARNYGMVVSSFFTQEKQKTIAAILGPKRMDYRKNVSLLEYFNEFWPTNCE